MGGGGGEVRGVVGAATCRAAGHAYGGERGEEDRGKGSGQKEGEKRRGEYERTWEAADGFALTHTHRVAQLNTAALGKGTCGCQGPEERSGGNTMGGCGGRGREGEEW